MILFNGITSESDLQKPLFSPHINANVTRYKCISRSQWLFSFYFEFFFRFSNSNLTRIRVCMRTCFICVYDCTNKTTLVIYSGCQTVYIHTNNYCYYIEIFNTYIQLQYVYHHVTIAFMQSSASPFNMMLI